MEKSKGGTAKTREKKKKIKLEEADQYRSQNIYSMM